MMYMYISATAVLYFKMYSFWDEVSYLVLLDTILVSINLPAKMFLLYKLVGFLSKF